MKRNVWIGVLIAAVLLSIAEVWLLIQAGHLIGVWWTLLILLAEAAVGSWLVRREGTRAWGALKSAFGGGRIPSTELADAALVLVGGVLFILPGFLTDIIGLVFLLPVTRGIPRRLLMQQATHQADKHGLTGLGTLRARINPDAETIPGEVVPDAAPQHRYQHEIETISGDVID